MLRWERFASVSCAGGFSWGRISYNTGRIGLGWVGLSPPVQERGTLSYPESLIASVRSLRAWLAHHDWFYLLAFPSWGTNSAELWVA